MYYLLVFLMLSSQSQLHHPIQQTISFAEQSLSLANLETIEDVFGNADMDDSCNLDYCNDERS